MVRLHLQYRHFQQDQMSESSPVSQQRQRKITHRFKIIRLLEAQERYCCSVEKMVLALLFVILLFIRQNLVS